MSDLTQLIDAANAGDEQASADLFQRVYGDLRKLTSARLANEDRGQTLQPTALVHEVYLRLFGPDSNGILRSPMEWRNRHHFFAAAESMRRILVDTARRKQRVKHGGGLQRVLLEPESVAEHVAESGQSATDQTDDILALHEALDALAIVNEKIARFVSLRYFAGLTIVEAAEAMDITERTGNSYWRYARAWLEAEVRKIRNREGQN